MGLGVWGLGFGVWGSGFRVEDLGSIQGVGLGCTLFRGSIEEGSNTFGL